MQSLRAYLKLFIKIAVPKKGRNTSHFLENLYGGVLFLKSYGKALLETFRKNSYPENSLIKFRTKVNAACNFTVFTIEDFTILAISFLLIIMIEFTFRFITES